MASHLPTSALSVGTVRMMNIGLTNEYFPPFAPGGAEWSVLALARALARSHRVTVITPNYGAAPYEEFDGVRVHRFNYPGRIEPGQTTLRSRWLANPFFYRHFARHIQRIAHDEHLDILHAQNKYALPGTWLASRRLRIPVVYTVRDTSMICPLGQCLIHYEGVHPKCGQWGHWWRDCRPRYIDNYFPGRRKSLKLNGSLVWLAMDTRLRRWFLRRVDGIIGVSEGILRVHDQAGLLTGQPTRPVYNLPPDDSPVPRSQVEAMRQRLGLDDQKVVLYAGRFSLGKGTADLVAAADIVVRKLPNVQFLFAGHGGLHPSGPHVRALGQLPHDQVWLLYHLADLVVVPSRQPEPLSRVLLEAMAAGRALVGTSMGGTPELIEEGVNGRLVARADPAELAEAIIDLLVNDARRAQMGRASLQRVRGRFAREATLERLLAFYRQTIATRGSRTSLRQGRGR